MWPYWMLFLVPATVALMQPSRPWAMQPPKGLFHLGPGWLWLAVVAALVIGFRHEVGGDWLNYEAHTLHIQFESLEEIVTRAEPAYWLVTWLTADVHWANLVFGAIFSLGLMIFCRAQPRPWLALAISVPYLVIVLGMGYTRQGVALALSMIGLVALQRRNTLGFVCCIVLGALFHKSAVLLMPLGIISTPRNRLWTTLWVAVAAFAVYVALLEDSVEGLRSGYIDAEYQSEGALVRVLMNVVPALLLLLLRRRFQWMPAERLLWTAMSMLALGSFGWLMVSASSTAVDRVALYLIPLQLYVFSRLPDLLTRPGESKRLLVILVLAYYGTAQFVWLFYATHAPFWLPYRFYPLEASF